MVGTNQLCYSDDKFTCNVHGHTCIEVFRRIENILELYFFDKDDWEAISNNEYIGEANQWFKQNIFKLSFEIFECQMKVTFLENNKMFIMCDVSICGKSKKTGSKIYNIPKEAHEISNLVQKLF